MILQGKTWNGSWRGRRRNATRVTTEISTSNENVPKHATML